MPLICPEKMDKYGISCGCYEKNLITMTPKMPYPDILLTIAGEQNFIKLEAIMYLEAKGSYTEVFLADGQRSKISKKLKLVLKILDSMLFVRVHHSYAINLKYLAGLNNSDGSTLKLHNGCQLPLSRSRKAEFLKLFKRL